MRTVAIVYEAFEYSKAWRCLASILPGEVPCDRNHGEKREGEFVCSVS